MHRTQSLRGKAKYLKRKQGFISSIKGVSHLSRRAKRRLYCKLQLWMWRKRREKCHFGILRAKKQAFGIGHGSGPCVSVKTQTQKNKGKVPVYHTPNLENSQVRTSVLVSPPGCDTGGSEDSLRRQNCLLKLSESVSLSETFIASSSLQNLVMDTNVSAGNITMPTVTVLPQKTETLVQPSGTTDPFKLSHTVQPQLSTDSDATTHFKEPWTMVLAQRLEVDGPSGQFTTVTPGQDQATNRDTDERITSKKTASSQTDISLKVLIKDIHEFLDDFYRIYGSFIPLQKTDVLKHLKRRFNTDFSDRKNVIFSEVTKYRTAIVQKPVPSFQVVYKKHTLTLDDLSTLADQNWLNDQVMNMYGELIMESAHHKVHFLNSFFHRQLMTKGYDGVKRWTKQVDLFSKSLLLVPIHLEVHWCLVTADIVKKKICLYDSQGNALQKVARNILKYLMTEAKEKKLTAFENGWAVSFDEKIPQQTNENDCGVFVLEYSRCLAMAKPLQFSQKDIPKIRKRIYKELCDCKLHEQG
ncbi:sentrin-specific protease 5-like [Siniperca chuatsi]|uniref:sentrin-specific protease 5-like n=1 Tax=Siniperca chuatsi TaxID=119488 RepID=UPI001CE13609|nr:sentrin-specific protease 5-like [Siniperca chuatsi]XP_044075962.1 sentrin-specific protease 5-like [Siniperca chuatsi]XP_044075963.1 sentrin-specific protease 5-like [Siniperca chuatsi]